MDDAANCRIPIFAYSHLERMLQSYSLPQKKNQNVELIGSAMLRSHAVLSKLTGALCSSSEPKRIDNSCFKVPGTIFGVSGDVFDFLKTEYRGWKIKKSSGNLYVKRTPINDVKYFETTPAEYLKWLIRSGHTEKENVAVYHAHQKRLLDRFSRELEVNPQVKLF